MKLEPEQDPDPYPHNTDPCLRIHIVILRILNTLNDEWQQHSPTTELGIYINDDISK